jgi:hypothetical protein
MPGCACRASARFPRSRQPIADREVGRLALRIQESTDAQGVWSDAKRRLDHEKTAGDSRPAGIVNPIEKRSDKALVANDAAVFTDTLWLQLDPQP